MRPTVTSDLAAPLVTTVSRHAEPKKIFGKTPCGQADSPVEISLRTPQGERDRKENELPGDRETGHAYQ
jgi:hypothetical protein